MEDILASIKRIIAEDSETQAARPARRFSRTATTPDFPATASAADEPEVLDLGDYAPDTPVAAPAAGPPIVSPDAATASRDSLEALTRALHGGDVEPVPGSGPTMETFVADLLRPMLRDWLDAHLPEMVEAMVAKEIQRITANR